MPVNALANIPPLTPRTKMLEEKWEGRPAMESWERNEPETKNYLRFKAGKGLAGNRSTKVDPMLANYAATQGEKRGYGREFPVALMGAESTFGRVGHGPFNPLSYKWGDEDPEEVIGDDPRFAKSLATREEFIKQGMPEKQADAMHNFFIERGLTPMVNIDKSFDLLDEKKRLLAKKNMPVNPSTLSWLYQGTGTPNRREIPHGVAYGKPVTKTKPGTGHSAVVLSIMRDLQKPDSELGTFIRRAR